MNADQGPDLIERLNLSGEPFIPKLGVSGEMSPKPAILLPEFLNLKLQLQEYRNRYYDY